MRSVLTENLKPGIPALPGSPGGVLPHTKVASSGAGVGAVEPPTKQYKTRPAQLAAIAKYRKAHPERIKKYVAEYYARNRERLLAKGREYRKSHGDQVKLKELAYREANREKARERAVRYRAGNPGKVREQVAKYRKTLKGAATMAADSAKRRQRVRNRVPWYDCRAVGALYKLAKIFRAAGVDVHVDHVVPLRGKTVSGLHVRANLQLSLATENLSKGNRCWPNMPDDVSDRQQH